MITGWDRPSHTLQVDTAFRSCRNCQFSGLFSGLFDDALWGFPPIGAAAERLIYPALFETQLMREGGGFHFAKHRRKVISNWKNAQKIEPRKRRNDPIIR